MSKEDMDFEKYKILVTARNFHYDNFSKWMTYFYVAIGAIFVGYCTTVKQTGSNMSLLLLVLGYLVSLFWFIACKGYYYWNLNFIKLVNYYESKVLKWEKSERIYTAIANKNTSGNIYISPISGANISTSKVTMFFSYTICVSWGCLFLNKIVCSLAGNVCLHYFLILLIVVFITAIFSFCSQFFFKSYTKHMVDYDIMEKEGEDGISSKVFSTSSESEKQS